MKGTSLGIGYRSGITNTINGTLAAVPLPSPPFPAGTRASFDGTLKLKTPGMLTIGASQDLNEFWTLKAGASWTNWSVLNSVPVSGAAAAPVAATLGSPNIPFNYKDSWMYSVGAEYKYRPDLTLRAGVGYEISPITTSNRTFRLPDANRLWLATGLTYAPTKAYSIDFGYAFLHGTGSSIASAFTGGPVLNNAVSGNFNLNIHLVSVAFKVKLDQVFGTPGQL
jgi:long-chain fatty acid transport protein